MAVAYDANSASSAGTGTLSWTHTPVGTPRGVLVLIAQDIGTSDEVTGVTYGGQAMAEVALSPGVKSGGETGVVYGYFLGSGIPTGAQTVVVSVSGGSSKRAVCWTVTGGRDTEVVDTSTVRSNSLDDPLVSLSVDNRIAWLAGVNLSGLGTVGGISPRSPNNASDLEHDFGNQVASWNRLTVPRKDISSTSAFEIAWTTSVADDVNALAVAVAEVAQPPAFDAGSHQNGTSTLSWTHTPVGTPRGVLVLIAQDIGTSDEVTGVTYGGQAMAEVALSPTLGSVSGGAVYGYFLGSGIPTGAQTVVVSVSGGSSKRAVCFTVTADDDTAVADTSQLDESSAAGTISVDLTLPSATRCLAFGVIYHGYPSASTISSGDDVSTFEEYAFGSSGVGSWVVGVRDETGPGTYPVEWVTTQSSYKQALAVAISVELPNEQPLSPAGLASTTALGTPMLSAAMSPAGLASTCATGTATLALGIAPAGIASAAGIGAPSLAMPLSVVGLAPTAGVGEAVVSIGLSAEGIDSTIALGEVSIGAALSPAGVASSAAVGTPTLSVALSPEGLASTTALGVAALTSELHPAGLASGAALGEPALSVSLAPAGIAAVSDVGAPTFSVASTPAGIGSASAIGSAGVGVSLSTGGIESGEALGTVTLSAGLAPIGIETTKTFGEPSLSVPVSVTGIAETVAMGLPALASALGPVGIASTEQLGEPSITVEIAPAGIGSALTFGTPTLATPLSAAAIASTSEVGSAALALGLAPTGVASAAAFGAPTLAAPLTVDGIASTAQLGAVALALGLAPDGIGPAATLGEAHILIALEPGLGPEGLPSDAEAGLASLSLRLSLTGIAPTSAVGEPSAEPLYNPVRLTADIPASPHLRAELPAAAFLSAELADDPALRSELPRSPDLIVELADVPTLEAV